MHLILTYRYQLIGFNIALQASDDAALRIREDEVYAR
jgi:hypothetical protein